MCYDPDPYAVAFCSFVEASMTKLLPFSPPLRQKGLIVTFLALMLLQTMPHALAQSTGTRIEKAPDRPLNIIRFDEPAEIAEIRSLLEQGAHGDAIDLALTLLERDKTPAIQYSAWNALCAARSKDNQWDGALEACEKAIAIRPRHWMARNSRANVYLMQGRYDLALDDFQIALANLAPGSMEAQVVEHNIAITESRRRAGGEG
jgi:tetratricopeptide (TPR) repeat protein